MGAMASQITSLTIVYSTVYSGAYQRTHQSSASLAFVRGIHRSPVNSPHIWPVTRRMFPFDEVIMIYKQPHSKVSNAWHYLINWQDILFAIFRAILYYIYIPGTAARLGQCLPLSIKCTFLSCKCSYIFITTKLYIFCWRQLLQDMNTFLVQTLLPLAVIMKYHVQNLQLFSTSVFKFLPFYKLTSDRGYSLGTPRTLPYWVPKEVVIQKQFQSL